MRRYRPLPFLATGLMLWKIAFKLDSPSSSTLIFWFQNNSPWLRVSINNNKGVRCGGRRAGGRSCNVKWWGTGNHAHIVSYANTCVWAYSTISGSCYMKQEKIQTLIFPHLSLSPCSKMKTLLFFWIWTGIQMKKILTSQDWLALCFRYSDDLSHILSK